MTSIVLYDISCFFKVYTYYFVTHIAWHTVIFGEYFILNTSLYGTERREKYNIKKQNLQSEYVMKPTKFTHLSFV